MCRFTRRRRWNLSRTQTTDKAELIALAERCELASGPDRELDHDIYLAADAALRAIAGGV